MFLSVRHKSMREEAGKYMVFNKDTKEEIPRVVWANDKTGRYRQYLLDENRRYIIEIDYIKSKIFTGNIELRKRQIKGEYDLDGPDNKKISPPSDFINERDM